MARIGTLTVKINMPKVKKAWAWESSAPNLIPRFLVFPTLSRRQVKEMKAYAENICGKKPNLRRVLVIVNRN